MVKIILNVDGEDREFNIPEEWEEVKVGQASKLFNLDREGKNQLELTISVVSILSDMDEELIYMMSQEQFMELVEVIKFTNEEVKGELKDFVTIDGDDYYLKKDFEKLTMGEIISIDTLINQSNGNLPNVMSKMLCILLRKKNTEGELETFRNSFMDREAMFNELYITDVNDVFLFFFGGNDS